MEDSALPAAQCQAVVLSCSDYRFVEPMRRFLARRGLTGTVDLIAWPGGAAALATPDRDAIIDTIRMACELDSPAEIVLVAHHDCDRLGGSACFAGPQAEIATLETALAIAGEVVAEQFPSLRLQLVRLDPNGPRTVIAGSRRDVPAVLAGSR
ncbi:MAG: carbonic anhydrase [Actinomycetota bacterium]